MFTIRPLFDVLPRSDYWRVEGRSGLYQGRGVCFKVPIGFETNFASIPRPVRWLVPVNGKHRLAAVAHDFLYAKLGHTDCGRVLTRKQIDRMFLSDMLAANVKPIKAYAMFHAVRLFGRGHWAA